LKATHPSALKTHQDILSIKSLPSETLGGIIGYIGNILKPFTEESIASIFCADEPTFSVAEIDDGKLVCVSIPQSFILQRVFINTLLKLFFYFHAQCRFDQSEEERAKHNQIFLCADEGQEIITSAYSAFADHRQAAILREAKATIILATQGYSSIYAALPKEHANVLISSLANQLIFQASSEENAKTAEGFLGMRRKKEFSYSFTGGKRTKSFKWEIVPYIHFFRFRNFPKFYCVAKLANGRWKQGYLPPITPEGKIPKWLWEQHPLIALRGLLFR
jgi:type IV secretory pathway TraG/TraD family ATPase VirD4